MSTEISPKIPCVFECSDCHYITSNKKDYTKHLMTIKHKTTTKSTFVNKNPQKSQIPFICDCGRYYKERSGLWRHKKKCDNNNND